LRDLERLKADYVLRRLPRIRPTTKSNCHDIQTQPEQALSLTHKLAKEPAHESVADASSRHRAIGLLTLPHAERAWSEAVIVRLGAIRLLLADPTGVAATRAWHNQTPQVVNGVAIN
jgi:hypothetical protein